MLVLFRFRDRVNMDFIFMSNFISVLWIATISLPSIVLMLFGVISVYEVGFNIEAIRNHISEMIAVFFYINSDLSQGLDYFGLLIAFSSGILMLSFFMLLANLITYALVFKDSKTSKESKECRIFGHV